MVGAAEKSAARGKGRCMNLALLEGMHTFRVRVRWFQRMAATVGLLFVAPFVISARASELCGTAATPPAVYEHVVWIFFENHSYSQIVGAREARFMNHVLGATCGLATKYRTLAHPSVPNYIAATSGQSIDALGPLRNDCNATGDCRTSADSIFAQVPSWKTYAESMPRPCTHWFSGRYAASHNPAVYYRPLADDCQTNAVGLGALASDIANDSLPAFAFIVPNMCHSMHDCGVDAGDRWLARVIRKLTASAAYARGGTAIFVTFDESDKADAAGRIATFVVAPSVPQHSRVGDSFTHYSLLRTTEEMLGLSRFLGRAAHARSMRTGFNL